MTEPLWGILCRTCEERIVFGRRNDEETGDIASFLKPGRFVCVRGHQHIYFSDDVTFFGEIEELTDSAIRKNRRKYRLLEDPT